MTIKTKKSSDIEMNNLNAILEPLFSYKLKFW